MTVSKRMNRFGRLLAALATALLLITLGGCSEKDDGTTPKAVNEKLPALKLTDDTPDLLLTWIDERGATHTGVSIAEVPESDRKQVRIITKTAGHGQLFYVADLRKKRPDGSYAVSTMARHEWEGVIEKRRAAYRAKHAPPPVASASSSASGHQAGLTAGITAIVYGAAWCKPCHHAAAFLKKRGVKVIEYDIERDRKRGVEMRKKLRSIGRPSGSIPVIDLAGTIIVGFSPRTIDRTIAKLKKGGTKL